ncbi:MAG TPA: hypothetical protein VGS96_17685 [Thermoanaerobaculia bacterium]|jgi:hypothetical protein|nr:hypothetical protein [Thermoanaerobaculia bacterium]
MNEERFEEFYRSAARFRHVSPQLKSLLRHVYAAAVTRPADLRYLKNAMESLLSFLATEGGRTDANCCTTDAFFSAVDEWERDWSDLPENFRDVLDDLGGALHDTVHAPHIASNFESLPEQLLQRVRKIV